MKHKLCFFLAITICLNFLGSWTFKAEAQPAFAWPVQSASDHLTGTFGEPRANGAPLGHWHKGIDIPKAAGTNVNRPATGTVTFEGSQSVVIHHENGWHTRLVHISIADSVEKGQAAPQIVGAVKAIAHPHVHMEVLEFNREKMNKHLIDNYRQARNPLRYVNLTTYPDADNPTTGEIRFNVNRNWNEQNTSLDAEDRFIDPDPEQDDFPTYFIVHAYDDITSTGATAPHKIRFSINELDGFEVWAKEIVFDDLLDWGGNLLQLTDVYADGSSMSNKQFYYYVSLDFHTVRNGIALNATGKPQNYLFKTWAYDKEGKVSADPFFYKNLTVPHSVGRDQPSAFVEEFKALLSEEGIEVVFKALWMPDIFGVHIWRSEGGAYGRITPQMIRVPDFGIVGRTFQFLDRDVSPGGEYTYKLGIVCSDGTERISDRFVARVTSDNR